MAYLSSMQRIKIYMGLSLVALMGLLLFWWADRYQTGKEQLQRELQLSVDEHLANEVLDIFNITLKADLDSSGLRRHFQPDSGKVDLQILVIEDSVAVDNNRFPRFSQTTRKTGIQEVRFPELQSAEQPIRRWLTRRDTLLEEHLDSLSQARQLRIIAANASDTMHRGDLLLKIRSQSPFQDAKMVRVDNYRLQLLAGMWPELTAGSLLLLLTLLAFWASWRTMRKQQQLVEDRDALLANLAHELKTPIATVGVALEALENFGAEADPGRRRDYLQLSRAELKRLDRLADQSLISLQLQDQKSWQQIPLEGLDLRKYITKSWELIQVRYGLDDAVLQHSLTAATPVRARPQHLEMVLDNLLTNAVKYGGPVLSIEVDSWQDGTRTKLRIADQGPGIPKLEAERIFERFYRIKDEQGHRQKGHGLGLHLARELMRTMDGDLYLDSNYQEGAAFIIEFVADV